MPARSAQIEDEAFERLILEMHARQPQRVLLPVFLAALMIAGIASRSSPHWGVMSWLALVIVVLAVRRIVVGNLHRQQHLPVKQRLHIAVLLMIVSGLVHGSSLLFFPNLSLFERAVHSMLLVGLSAGCVATAQGYRPLFLAYALPTLMPLAMIWAATPGLRNLGWVHGLMSVIILLFAWALHAFTRDTYRILRESYDIRLEREALTRELRAALEAAESASRAKTRFLASASHDLRQPMQTLSLFAAALALRPLDERSRAIAENINDALQDLTVELDALLDVSKLDAGVVEPQLAAVHLQPLLRRCAEVFGPAVQEKRLRLTLNCPADACVRTDRKLLERILRNLIENAIKYTDAGEVRISAVADSDCWRLCVADTGCGIPAAEQSRVFEEFYQVNNPERNRARGLGLGLAIVKRLADLLDTPLSLRSAHGVGTEFELTFTGASQAMVHRPGPAAVQESVHPRHILVVDDEEDVRAGMRALLEECGCTVDLAGGTEEAVATVRRAAPDVIVADLRLRGDDNGIRAIEAIRAIHPSVHALLLSGDTAPHRLREVQRANIAILHKPVSADALKRALATADHKNNKGQSNEQHDSDEPEASGSGATGTVDLARVRGTHSRSGNRSLQELP